MATEADLGRSVPVIVTALLASASTPTADHGGRMTTPAGTQAKSSPATPAPASPAGSDVLHADHPSHFTVEEIAKAVARHQREHPSQAPRAARPQKTTPRR